MHPGRGRSLSATWNTASTPVAAFGTHPFEGCATTRPPMRSTYRVVTESLQQCKSERFADGQFGGCIGARFRSLSKRRDHLRARMYQTRMARRDASEQYARKPPISIQVRSPKGPGLYQRNLDFTTAASGEWIHHTATLPTLHPSSSHRSACWLCRLKFGPHCVGA